MGGVDIVLHVADEGRICRVDLVLAQQVVDVFLLVAHTGVDVLEVILEPQETRLFIEGARIHTGQYEAADAAAGAEVHEGSGMRNDGDLGNGMVKGVAVVFLQVHQSGLRGFAGVIIRVGKLELIAELLSGQGGSVILGQHVVGGFQGKGKVIAQRAGPVEDEVLEHGVEKSAFGGDDVVFVLVFEDGSFQLGVDEGVVLAVFGPGSARHAVEIHKAPVYGGRAALDAQVITHRG